MAATRIPSTRHDPTAVPSSVLPGRAMILDSPGLDSPETSLSIGASADRRHFSVYEPPAAFGLVAELDFLARRAVEPNVFFAPQFLVPAMPRLDDREVRLLVARDEDQSRSRLRLLMPFSQERAGLVFGQRTVRAWTHPFGPLGTLPVDGDDPSGTLASLLEALASPELSLPPVLVLPDLRMEGRMALLLQAKAAQAGLPVAIVGARRRAALDATGRAEDFRTRRLAPKRRREFARQRRLLERRGRVSFDCAAAPAEIRLALEDFLILEAGGWKGRERSAMLLDRYRAAFAREAVNALAEAGRARIYTLRLDSACIASVVVFVLGGEAVLWKTAYDEALADVSPGFQLMVETSEALIADPSIAYVDSCAIPDHPLMNRIWAERVEIATLVVGLRPDQGRAVRRAAAGIERRQALGYRLWRVRNALSRLTGRS